MKKIRVFAVLLLCVALLAFAGCGEKKSDQDTENGTVTEETLNHDEETKGTDDGSAMDEMKDGAEKASVHASRTLKAVYEAIGFVAKP